MNPMSPVATPCGHQERGGRRWIRRNVVLASQLYKEVVLEVLLVEENSPPTSAKFTTEWATHYDINIINLLGFGALLSIQPVACHHLLFTALDKRTQPATDLFYAKSHCETSSWPAKAAAPTSSCIL